MKPETPFHEFIDNTYFNAYFLEFEMRPYFEKRHQNDCQKAFENIKKFYQNTDIQLLSEAQLEEEFIKPVLRELGYAFTYEVPRIIFGKNYVLDFALYKNDEIQREAYQNHRASNKNMLAICESKSYNKTLDTKKVLAKDNPHFQLFRYQSDLRVNFGFLTNGKYWRFYDVTEQRQDKIYYEVDLEWIIKNDNPIAFEFFYFVFYKNNLLKMNQIDDSEATAKDIAQLNREAIMGVENDLKEVIYGTESVVEKIGQRFFDRHKDKYSLRQIYANSVIFAYRMLFIAYCESKFGKVLLDEEYTYQEHSLTKILMYLETHPHMAKGKPKYVGWSKLKVLFNYLNHGDLDLKIPLLNGGLFAEEKAPLLKKPLILNDEELQKILSQLLYHKNSDSFRDYKTLSVTHLGNIYEGLLETELRQPIEKTYYLIFQEGKTEKEGYFDIPDYQQLRKNKKVKIFKELTYERGDIFLSNQSNTRKSTASYYTPKDMTDFMTEESISKILETKASILDLRIMDNACGSGHFLVEILNVLTKKALERLEDEKDTKLKQLFEHEKMSIEKNIEDIFYADEYHLDDLTVLKRILLKKVIFGVDLNGFAIELTRLSLWLDTFVLGTPLSFIEHHLCQGNALIGARKKDLIQKLGEKNPLLAGELKQNIEKLIQKLEQLSNLKDNTAEEIAESKQIYQDLQPDLQRLNLVMHFQTYEKFVPLMYQNKDERNQILGELGTVLSDFEKAIFEEQNIELINKIQKIAQLFNFFHYEITFAEVFQNGHSGFDLIIGNPPWDVMEFNDADFFSGWRSSYRTMKQSEKKETRENILDYAGIQKEYDNKKQFRTNLNQYCKKYYPLNEGGKGNLFRFFIERNLQLLTKDGILTYITPSAWIYEDSSITIRKHILEKYNLHFFYQFENRKGIFPRVHRSYKFAMFMLTPVQPNQKRLETIPVRFMQTDTRILYKTDYYDGKAGILQYPFSAIAELSPDYQALFEIKAQKDLELIRSAYQKFEKINPDFIDFRNELNLTSDRDIFQEQKDDMILYEGKMIHQFKNNVALPQYWVKKSDLEAKLRKTEVSRMVNDIYDDIQVKKLTKRQTVLDFLNLKDESELEKLTVLNTEFYRLVFRDIARNTDERSIISGIIPPNHTYGNTLQGSVPKKYILKNGKVEIEPFSYERLLFVQSIFNSLISDYIIRFLIDIHVNKTYLMRLPMPQPSDEELATNDVYKKLIINSLKLNLFYNPDFKSMQFSKPDAFEMDKIEPPKNEKSRLKTQIENDILIAKLYGVDKEGMAHLTSGEYFKVLNEKQPEYRELLLEIFDEIC